MTKSDKKRKKKARRGIKKCYKAIKKILDQDLMNSFGLRKLNRQTNQIEKGNELLNQAFNG